MEVMTGGVLDDAQRSTLAALCDTYVPSIESQTHDPLERDFLARAASDLQIPAHIEAMMAEAMTPEEIAGMGGLLDALAQNDFAGLPLDARVQTVKAVAAADPLARLGLHQVKGLTMLLFYTLPDEQGRNPNWEALGYPGATSPPPSPQDAPKTINLAAVSGPEATLDADAVIVGSGAGGGVIAATLAEAGKRVLVLEVGQYRNESDFKNLELSGYQELYYGGGLAASENGSIAILAGQTLGGGTVVNYMNCIRTPEWIRREWAQEHGLEGVDDPAFETEHIDRVWERLNANAEATQQNNTHQRLMQGLDELGMQHRPIVRNVTLEDDPEQCGFCAYGCPRGCKRSSMKTWLQDASDFGAEAIVGCHAERILTTEGRASGVEATVTREDGSTTKLTIEAPIVVVACGSVESPALLLRSGIGGPAVGKHLRLQPAFLVNGVYEERIEGWRGQIQSLVSDHFRNLEGEHGFLIEATSMHPGIISGAAAWDEGASHKAEMMKFPWTAPFISVARDHGEGEVVIDDRGRPVVRWGLGDEVDLKLAKRANVELARLHKAAGAREIHTLHDPPRRWIEGDDFEAFLAGLEHQAGYGPQECACFTAHQMGSCRMGSDPSASVADGRGELHDVKGVWIGDASAFPTAPGVNPMISIMSLASRTASKIVEAG
ncbi:MAG: GMC family oxidoreductase N-terminal domain-containing protein [Thermoleophilaceae bacterium]|nr:GMC family oxidoreductase N-terminal domain-containing protein [Thermoleophilaceae bacterium]